MNCSYAVRATNEDRCASVNSVYASQKLDVSLKERLKHVRGRLYLHL